MDVGVSKDGRHFYTLNGNQGTVSVFTIQGDGSLVRLQSLHQLKGALLL